MLLSYSLPLVYPVPLHAIEQCDHQISSWQTTHRPIQLILILYWICWEFWLRSHITRKQCMRGRNKRGCGPSMAVQSSVGCAVFIWREKYNPSSDVLLYNADGLSPALLFRPVLANTSTIIPVHPIPFKDLAFCCCSPNPRHSPEDYYLYDYSVLHNGPGLITL